MNKIVNWLFFWLKAARAYSFPMSIMSWCIPFLFGILNGGNAFYGLVALVGILLAHAGVNFFDDYVDFYIAKCKYKNISEINLQKGKCVHLLDGTISHIELLFASFFCFFLALICGIFLAIKTGIVVIYIVFIAAIIGLLYPLLTFIAIGEVAVAIMFAPLLYLGVYYVMTQSFSVELMPIAISTGLLTVAILHAHMFLDIDFDAPNNKITLCRLAGSKMNAAKNQIIFIFLAYLNIILFPIININISKWYFITLLSLPTAFFLCKTMIQSVKNPNQEIHTNIFFGVLENLQEYKKIGNLNFMIIFMTARNIMVEFTLLICFAKILSEL